MAILINIYVIIIFLCPEFEVHINKLLGTIFDIGINEASKTLTGIILKENITRLYTVQ